MDRWNGWTRGSGSHKLTPRYIGPYKILKHINPVTYRLEHTRHLRIHPTFHVSKLKPVVPGPLAADTPSADLPTPLEINGKPAYTVANLLRSWRRNGQPEYLMDWEGCGLEEQSWVTARDILDTLLIQDFNTRHLDQPAPRPQGRPRFCSRRELFEGGLC